MGANHLPFSDSCRCLQSSADVLANKGRILLTFGVRLSEWNAHAL
jgi:hypothetical protein